MSQMRQHRTLASAPKAEASAPKADIRRPDLPAITDPLPLPRSLRTDRLVSVLDIISGLPEHSASVVIFIAAPWVAERVGLLGHRRPARSDNATSTDARHRSSAFNIANPEEALADARILKVIDLAYQAAIDAALWEATLEAAADALGGSGAALVWRSGSESGGVTTRSDPEAMRQYVAHYAAINPIQTGFERMRMSDLIARPVMTDRACVRRDEFVAGEYYNGFWRPNDLGSVLMITGAGFLVDGKAPAFNVFRSIGADEFDAAELEIAALIHQPLQRAHQMSRRLARERRLNESLGEFVAQLSGAVFAVEGDGSIVYANPAGEAMLAQRDGLYSDRRQLRAHSADTQRRLAAMLASGMGDSLGRRRGGSLSVPRPSGRRALALLATPTRGGSDPLAHKPLVLLSVADPEVGALAPEERLRAYFGLTPAEARVAAEMIAGYDAREIAERLGRSFHTVRVQIGRIRESTESRRQGEAVAVMLRALGVGGLSD